MAASLRIAILAAEPSGDILGAGLMVALRRRLPNARFEGIGGPLMLAAGLDDWEPMESLSVMGLIEVLRHLPRLLRLRRRLAKAWTDDPPALFIGVDAPDFNLALEARLRAQGVPTVHYVSPTVWAWRPQRVKLVRRAVDLLLSIFPFERDFLAAQGVPVRYVGHPLAAEMPLEPPRSDARQRLGLAAQAKVLALLPGSRRSEVSSLARPFLQTAVAVSAQIPDLCVVVPLVSEATRVLFEQAQREWAPDLTVQIVMRDSRNVLAAADAVLTASGTATFEALLSKRAMVVGYKLHVLSYWLARVLRLVNVKHVAMANLLADERLAAEFIQDDCEPSHLVPEVLRLFEDHAHVAAIAERYGVIHEQLRMATNDEAAEAVLELLRGRHVV